MGGYYKKGDSAPGNRLHFKFTYTRRLINKQEDIQEAIKQGYTLIETPEQAVEWFRWYVEETGAKFAELKGKNLACWCKEGSPCHGDVILEIANR